MRRLFHYHVLTKALLGLIAFLLLIVSPVAAMSIDATQSIPNWAFSPGPNTNPITLTLTVTTEKAPWSVTVMDEYNGGKDASYAGRLVEYNSSTETWVNNGHIVSTNMTVTGQSIEPDIAGTSATLGPEENTIETGSAAVSGQELAITLQQPITYADAYLSNGNIYRADLTFTVYQT